MPKFLCTPYESGSSHFGVYGVWLEVGLDGLSEASGVEQSSGDVVVEVAEAEGYVPEGLEPAVDGLGGAVRAVGVYCFNVCWAGSAVFFRSVG